jgi:hypothetical protein
MKKKAANTAGKAKPVKPLGSKLLLGALALVIVAGLFVGYALTSSSVRPGSCKIDLPQGPAVAVPAITPAEPEFGNDSEIGKPCSNDSDCRLPMSYAVRSSCPYAMRCANSSCEVYCPWSEVPGAVINTSAVPAAAENATAEAGGNATLLLFWSVGCPLCAAEKKFLEGIRGDYPELTVISYELSKSEENAALLQQMCDARQMACDRVPVTFVGGMAFKSYKGDEGALTKYAGEDSYVGYGNQIENAIRAELGMPPKKDLNAWKRGLRLFASTDKAAYTSHENITVTARVYVLENVTGCILKARGIRHSEGYYFDQMEMANLAAGNNTFVLTDRAPLCFGCANFRPGNYEIDVWLEKAGEKLKEVTLKIEIRE